jgi:hypothetical protein
MLLRQKRKIHCLDQHPAGRSDMKTPSYIKNINLRSISRLQEIYRNEPAYDVRKIGTPLSQETRSLLKLYHGPYFELRGFDDNGVNYFDSESDRGVWSIGRHKKTGLIVASLTSDLYQTHSDSEWDSIWLR